MDFILRVVGPSTGPQNASVEAGAAPPGGEAALLQEGDGYILQEDGFRLLIEE